jgi:hypothetical protein
VTICAVVLAVLVAAGGGAPEAQSYKNTAPESFRANGQATEGVGGIASSMTFQIDAYTPDGERERLLKALASGGSPAFVAALKKAPAAGYIEAGKRKVVIRYAREVKTPRDGRRIVLVTDTPVYFVGGGAIDAKPTEGFDVAVVQFEVDMVGLGSGTMAAAAKVKAGGPAGVEIDDYAKDPIKLVTVTRNLNK